MSIQRLIIPPHYWKFPTGIGKTLLVLTGYLLVTAFAISIFEPGLTPPGFTGRGARAMCVVFVGAFHVAGRCRSSWIFLVFGTLGALLLLPCYLNDSYTRLNFQYGYTTPNIAINGWTLFIVTVALLTRMSAVIRWQFIPQPPPTTCTHCGRIPDANQNACLECGHPFDQLPLPPITQWNWNWLIQRALAAAVIILVPYFAAASWLYWRSEQPLVDRLAQAGGHADMKEELPRQWSVLPQIIQASFSHVEMVDFGSGPLNETQISILAQFPYLREIHFDHTAFSGKGLAHLRNLTHLTSLYMPDSLVDDAGLVEIGLLEHLEELQLSGTRVTDSGLKSLSHLPHLRCLWLDRTLITDDGLMALRELPNLNCVEITGSHVTKTGIELFTTQRPSVKIISSEPERF